MDYDIQKLILENAIVYNILLNETLLGHIVNFTNGQKYIIQADDSINFSLIAEEFGFSGNFTFLNENVKLNLHGSNQIKEANYKVFNFDYLTLDELNSL